MKSLAEDPSWTRLVDVLKNCGYEDEDLKALCSDFKQLGISKFEQGVPASTNPRSRAVLQRFLAILIRLGVATPGDAHAAPLGSSGVPQAHTLFLGKVMAAAVRQDSKAIEDLTSQIDPSDQLRKLVAAAQQGEPMKELEPDEAALRTFM